MVIVTGGQIHEVNILDQLIWEAGAIYLMDRAYVDFRSLYRMHQSGAFFVTRAQKKIRLSTSLLSDGGQKDRLAMRSNCHAQQSNSETWLSRTTSSSALLRCCNPKTAGISYQQFSLARFHHHSALSVSLAVELFFSMDQTASTDQCLLWHFAKCGQNPGLDRHLSLRVGCHRQKRLNLQRSLHSILQILSVSLLEKVPILEALSQPEYGEIKYESPNQLI